MKTSIDITESMSIALRSLLANKLRSFLTLLGIIIGVTTVITVVTIIQGLNRYVKYQMFAFGTNSFTVSRAPEMITSLKQAQEMLKRKRIEYGDYLYLKANARVPRLIEAEYGRRATVKYGASTLAEIYMRGESHGNYLTGRTMEAESGRFLNADDEAYARQVCVIGYDIQKELFPFENPVGKWLRADGRKYRIIGVVKGMGKILGQSLDAFMTIPITTFQKYYASNRRSLTINVLARDLESLQAAKDEVRTIMRGRRKLTFAAEDDFSIEDSQTFIDFYNQLTGTLYAAMIAVAAISMLIGGIVIMNIMLVAVTERIGEIGLRKAVGARRRDILAQFLIESSTISAAGGVIGITLGFIFAKVISALTSLPAALEPWSVALALLLSSSVGLFFGIFPANRAAKLDPVVALRAE
ncbi:MAG TPA: ABC transporter permease [Candidatus Aminicenantes bacterium]|nr:ABC transporter permease [Candidatus Aminicenantes bacterium]